MYQSASPTRGVYIPSPAGTQSVLNIFMPSIVLTMYQCLEGHSVLVCRERLDDNLLIVFRDHGWQAQKHETEKKSGFIRQMRSVRATYRIIYRAGSVHCHVGLMPMGCSSCSSSSQAYFAENRTSYFFITLHPLDLFVQVLY